MFGAPVNQEDRLATIMGFSYLLIDGIHRLGLPLQDEEAEDLYYLWHVFARLMGIRPEAGPHDASYIPPTIADAGDLLRRLRPPQRHRSADATPTASC